MTNKEMRAVMKHYDDGGQVEAYNLDKDDGWDLIGHSSWDWSNYNYRIVKPKEIPESIEKWTDKDFKDMELFDYNRRFAEKQNEIIDEINRLKTKEGDV